MLKSLRKYAMTNNIPIISSNTEKFIIEILNKYKPKYCLEIGTAIGYSSIIIGKEIQKHNGLLYTFEIGYTSYRQALKNFQKYNIYNIIAYNLDFLNIDLIKFFPFKFDFVFIDGLKKKYKDFLKKILPFVNKNGIIILDDVIKFKDKMKNLYDFLEISNLNYEILKLDHDDGIIFINLKY